LPLSEQSQHKRLIFLKIVTELFHENSTYLDNLDFLPYKFNINIQIVSRVQIISKKVRQKEQIYLLHERKLKYHIIL
jgi:hypothetical protein